MGLPTVTAAAFQRGFGRCQNDALKHPIATTRNGRDRTELNEFIWPARIYGTRRQGVLIMVFCRLDCFGKSETRVLNVLAAAG